MASPFFVARCLENGSAARRCVRMQGGFGVQKRMFRHGAREKAGRLAVFRAHHIGAESSESEPTCRKARQDFRHVGHARFFAEGEGTK